MIVMIRTCTEVDFCEDDFGRDNYGHASKQKKHPNFHKKFYFTDPIRIFILQF
jgi:hypothetical protein